MSHGIDGSFSAGGPAVREVKAKRFGGLFRKKGATAKKNFGGLAFEARDFAASATDRGHEIVRKARRDDMRARTASRGGMLAGNSDDESEDSEDGRVRAEQVMMEYERRGGEAATAPAAPPTQGRLRLATKQRLAAQDAMHDAHAEETVRGHTMPSGALCAVHSTQATASWGPAFCV